MAVTFEKRLKVTGKTTAAAAAGAYRYGRDEDDRRRALHRAAATCNYLLYTLLYYILLSYRTIAECSVRAGCIVTVNAVGSHYGTMAAGHSVKPPLLTTTTTTATILYYYYYYLLVIRTHTHTPAREQKCAYASDRMYAHSHAHCRD